MADVNPEEQQQDHQVITSGLSFASPPEEPAQEQEAEQQEPKAKSKFGGPQAGDAESEEQAQKEARKNQAAIDELEKLFGKNIHKFYLDHVTAVEERDMPFGKTYVIRFDEGKPLCVDCDPKTNERTFGFWGHQKNFDETDAKKVIFGAMSAGLKGGSLFGPEKHKELMWLEAQMAGFETDFVPKTNSPIWDKLAERQKQERDLNGAAPKDYAANPQVDACLSSEIEMLKSVPDADAMKAAQVVNVIETIQDTFRDGSAEMTGEQQQTFMDTQKQSGWKEALKYYTDNSAVRGDDFAARVAQKSPGFEPGGPANNDFAGSKFSGAPKETTQAAQNNAKPDPRKNRTLQLQA